MSDTRYDNTLDHNETGELELEVLNDLSPEDGDAIIGGAAARTTQNTSGSVSC